MRENYGKTFNTISALFTTRVIALCWPLQRTQVPRDFTFQTQLLLIFYLKYFGLAEEK